MSRKLEYLRTRIIRHSFGKESVGLGRLGGIVNTRLCTEIVSDEMRGLRFTESTVSAEEIQVGSICSRNQL